MIGLGRMGANMVRRLMRDQHTCVVYDHSPAAVQALVKEGATGADSLDSFVAQLTPPRSIWLMVPAAVVDPTLQDLTGRLQSGDAIVDGGNSFYVDDLRRSAGLESAGIAYVDVGTSGGIWGLERGYCLMIGGPAPVVDGSFDEQDGEAYAVQHLTVQELDLRYPARHDVPGPGGLLVESADPTCRNREPRFRSWHARHGLA